MKKNPLIDYYLVEGQLNKKYLSASSELRFYYRAEMISKKREENPLCNLSRK